MKKVSNETIKKAVEILKNGGVIVYPTETSYGIGCDATNHAAVEKILKIKGRPENKPMAAIVEDIEMAKLYGEMGEIETRLAEKHWPGPLTIVLQNAPETLSPHCKRGTTSSVRVPDSEIALALVKGLGRPIIATSANIHRGETCYNPECVKEQLKNQEHKPDMYVDAGKLPIRPVSMIIEVINGEIVVHRQGSFKL